VDACGRGQKVASREKVTFTGGVGPRGTRKPQGTNPSATLITVHGLNDIEWLVSIGNHFSPVGEEGSLTNRILSSASCNPIVDYRPEFK